MTSRESDEFGGGPQVSIGGQQTQEDDSVPQMEVYDQAEFIKKRDAKIKQIKRDAKDLNGLAGEINGKVHEQDQKLDDLNKELSYNVEEVKKANKDLERAAELSSGSNKCLIYGILIAAIVVLVLVVTIFFL
jgi:t-SNARE complex subunit (syntaxin)